MMLNQALKQDVLVVGAGPAGLSAGFSAARRGASVAIFEKSKEIGYPIHTSGGSWIAELRELGIPDRFMHPIRAGLFLSPNESALFKYEKPDSCVLDVRGLYQYLAELASGAGARIFANCRVLGPVLSQGKLTGLRVNWQGKEHVCHAKIIIDASGASSLLGKRMGLTTGFARIGVGAEYDLHAPGWPEDKVAFMFGSRVAPCGYSWVFPRGQQRVRVGVGVIRPDSTQDPRLFLDQVCAAFPNEFSHAGVLEYHAGILPSESYLKQTYEDNLLLTGDAGALISTLLGEGIRFAIDIGRMAGQVAAEAASTDRYDKEFLRQYQKRWQKKYKRLFRCGHLINQRLAQYDDEAWDRKIRLLRQLDPKFLPPLLKGQLSAKLLLRLMSKNPGLVSKALGASLTAVWQRG